MPDTGTKAEAGAEVAVVGLGYVGLTLAVALARSGVRTLGFDRLPAAIQGIAAGEPCFNEPGVAEALRSLPAGALVLTETLPERLPPYVVVCVGSPVDPVTHAPDLSQLRGALEEIGPRLDEEAVVIVRSTVPVGTTEGFVRERLARFVDVPRVAFCPERTIQGKALRELGELPQVVGSDDPDAALAAADLLSRLGAGTVGVSSAAAAEMVKLVCNAHTDVLYGFGNEVALMAHTLGLDAGEVIAAANRDYPRPPISAPGYVGGSCLVKDPYLLSHSVAAADREPLLVTAARQLNESVPRHVAERVRSSLAAAAEPAAGEATLLVAGLAYKGSPVTDDTRGNAAGPLVECLRGSVGELRGQDYVVPAARIRELGLEPVGLGEGFRGCHAAVLLNDHPSYRGEEVRALIESMRPPRVIYDLWGLWRNSIAAASELGCTYLRLGHD